MKFLKKYMQKCIYLCIFLIFLLISSTSFAEQSISDLYDFSVNQTSISPVFFGNDSNNNGMSDSILCRISLNQPNMQNNQTLNISFDVFKNELFLRHLEFPITKGTNTFDLGRFSSGNYHTMIMIYAGRENQTIFKNDFLFSAIDFEAFYFNFQTEPLKKQATYKFIDTNNDSLYEFLEVFPEGDITLFDFDDVLLKTNINKIDLMNFYIKKVEPTKISVNHDFAIYEADVKNITYTQFARPILPDLSILIDNSSIILSTSNASAFDFYVSIYENESLVLHKKIDYIKKDETYKINYVSSLGTSAYADLENRVQETTKENNFAKVILVKNTITNQEQQQVAGIQSSKNPADNLDAANSLEKEPLNPQEPKASINKVSADNSDNSVDNAKKTAQKTTDISIKKDTQNSFGFFDFLSKFWNLFAGSKVSKDSKDSADLKPQSQESKQSQSNLILGNAVSNLIPKPKTLVSIGILIGVIFVIVYSYAFLFKEN